MGKGPEVEKYVLSLGNCVGEAGTSGCGSGCDDIVIGEASKGLTAAGLWGLGSVEGEESLEGSPP